MSFICKYASFLRNCFKHISQIFVDELIYDTVFLESVLARNPRLLRRSEYMQTERVFELPRSEFEIILAQADAWQPESEIKVIFMFPFCLKSSSALVLGFIRTLWLRRG